ncbi:MAG TPA: right-handed parallel beta-helix repeat-containing protein [Longimicrobium sp.]|nr:right-handed parallel beta-helix repeat-containing protein [Longimicrobium sp.]
MHPRNSFVFRAAAFALLAGVVGACADVPTGTGEQASARGGEPSLLISAACANPKTTHSYEAYYGPATWTRAGSPHYVENYVYVENGGRLVIQPGAVVCFAPRASMIVENGGRLLARGRDTAQIVFTARERALGWRGLFFTHTNGVGASYLTNVRVEHAAVDAVAITATGHPLIVDSAVIRQSGRAVELGAAGSRLSRSRVDTTTARGLAAVSLRNAVKFEGTVIRGSAGVGLDVGGGGVTLLGGRIEGSRSTGLRVPHDRWGSSSTVLGSSTRPIRVVGSGSYGAELNLMAMALLYPTPAQQDSLLGNARDTLVIDGGSLSRGAVTVGPRLPVRTTFYVSVDTLGVFTALPGARIAFSPNIEMKFAYGGRLNARGSKAAPVVFTADDPTARWGGLRFENFSTAVTSYLTNTVVEHTGLDRWGVHADLYHRVIVDSSVIRNAGGGALYLHSTNSRVSRTRVDTTYSSELAAVNLGANARIESTLIRAASGIGLTVASPTVVVASCEIRDGDGVGIFFPEQTTLVRNCNLVNNGGVGVQAAYGGNPDARYNWWGSADGPAGAGGDGAAEGVIHTPWRTTPYVLPYVPAF